MLDDRKDATCMGDLLSGVLQMLTMSARSWYWETYSAFLALKTNLYGNVYLWHVVFGQISELQLEYVICDMRVQGFVARFLPPCLLKSHPDFRPSKNQSLCILILLHTHSMVKPKSSHTYDYDSYSSCLTISELEYFKVKWIWLVNSVKKQNDYTGVQRFLFIVYSFNQIYCHS